MKTARFVVLGVVVGTLAALGVSSVLADTSEDAVARGVEERQARAGVDCSPNEGMVLVIPEGSDDAGRDSASAELARALPGFHSVRPAAHFSKVNVAPRVTTMAADHDDRGHPTRVTAAATLEERNGGWKVAMYAQCEVVE